MDPKKSPVIKKDEAELSIEKGSKIFNRPIKLTNFESAAELIRRANTAYQNGRITEKQNKTLTYNAQTFLSTQKVIMEYLEIPRIIDYFYNKQNNFFHGVIINFLNAVKKIVGKNDFERILLEYDSIKDSLRIENEQSQRELLATIKKRTNFTVHDKRPTDVDSIVEFVTSGMISLPQDARDKVILDLISKDIVQLDPTWMKNIPSTVNN